MFVEKVRMGVLPEDDVPDVGEGEEEEGIGGESSGEEDATA